MLQPFYHHQGCKFVDEKRFLLKDKESRAADNNKVQSTAVVSA